MANLNRIILVGRLTADLESRSTMDGIPMAKFRLAVGRPQGGDDFFDVIAWRREAESLDGKAQKGTMVLVEGRIQIRSFEDQSGQRRWVTEVVARKVQVLEKANPSTEPFDKLRAAPSGVEVLRIGAEGSRSTDAQGSTSLGKEASATLDEASLADDLPF